MEIIIAKTAGFCFGVDKAVGMATKLVEEGMEPIYMLGPVIHNEQVIERLTAAGAKIVDNIDEVEAPSSVLIRAHGIPPEVYSCAEEKGLKLLDATCPYVKKIQKLVAEKFEEGCRIIIIGDREHPEVKGINGWCKNTAYIVNSAEDVEGLEKSEEKTCVVAQTTITCEKWETATKYLENKFKNIEKFDTICYATSYRQKEAVEIAKTVDMMLVIGGSNSSNTQKLYEVCTRYCNNVLKVETPGDITPLDIKKYKKIGITAGASTPDWIIKEVIRKMDELNRQENELNFKEVFESSLVTLRSGEVVKGKIIGFNSAEIYVDLGYKSDGIIQMEEYSDDPDFKPEQELKAGDEIEVFIVRVNDSEGTIQLSKKKVDSMKTWEKIEEAYANKTPVKAKVVEVVSGGVIAVSGGIRIFVPASQISDRYVKDLGEFVKQILTLRIIEFVKQKRKIVGSQRVILEEEKAKKSTEFWENIEIGKKYEGVVKSFTDFGAFVDIGGVDGLIHLSELSWTKIKHPSEVLKAGEKVEVTVLEFDREKKKVSLGYKKSEDNPWVKASEKYKVGEVVKGKVVRLVPFGAFIELEKGVDGLVHISQISNVRIAKPSDVLEIGQEVDAKVTEFNIEAKKISLSIKELNPIDPVGANTEVTSEVKKADGEAVPTEHKEEMPITIGDIAAGLNEVEQEKTNE